MEGTVKELTLSVKRHGIFFCSDYKQLQIEPSTPKTYINEITVNKSKATTRSNAFALTYKITLRNHTNE